MKCRLYLGADYEFSTKKVEACKSGLLTSLDKVETAAQARCARLFGIGTEYALEREQEAQDEADTPAPLQNNPVTLSSLKKAVLSVGLASNREQWASFKREQLGQDVLDDQLTPEQIVHLWKLVSTHISPPKSVEQSKPAWMMQGKKNNGWLNGAGNP